MISLPPLGDLEDALWVALLEVSERHPDDWTLIGGQMVLLHALEHEVRAPRISRDLDLVADARARPSAVQSLARTLGDLGFDLSPAAPDEVAHRFSRGLVSIDLVAPDGLGQRADLRVAGTVMTTEIRGGTYALQRSETIEVEVGGRRGRIARPDLAGAIVVKSFAALADRRRGPERHVSDLALLLSIVPDPFALASEMNARQRRVLGRVEDLAEREGRVWKQFEPGARATGLASYEVLSVR